MQLATPEAFARDPERVHAFYNARRRGMIEARPNAAHLALAALERGLASRGGALFLCTQNIDDLHERAGARGVIHMHGEIARALCGVCDTRWEAPSVMNPADLCPSCGAQATRPDVVWFGEMPYHMDRIADAVEAADLFVAIGTSGEVYPAAGFVDIAAASGAETLEINLEPTPIPGRFDRVITGPATRAVPAWVAEILS
jgi:NAD-dependent deacetylase